MISSKAEALGIIFPNSYDSLVPDLVSERLMASIPVSYTHLTLPTNSRV